MSSEITNFVNVLTSEPPGAPHSVQLIVDTDGDIHAIYEVLLMIMTEILKKWYSPPISISRVSPSDLERLQAYFASFGFKLTLQVIERIQIGIDNRDYLQKSRLEDMHFRLAADDGRTYTVFFSNFPRI
jgi:hypothetical protein